MSTRAPWFGGAYARNCDLLSPPPRRVELTFQARCLRAGLLAGLLLVPNAVLVVGSGAGGYLRPLANEGRSAAGRILPTGCSTGGQTPPRG
jgi:hypothetical protein